MLVRRTAGGGSRRARRAPRRAVVAVMLAGLVAMAVGCGSSSVSIALDPPQAGDPAHGAAAQILISNLGIEFWVGDDSAATVEKLRMNEQTGKEEWLIAAVVPEAGHRFGFYFAPGDVDSQEVTIEAMQTTLSQIRADPAYYAVGGAGHLPKWAVSAEVLTSAP